MKKDGGLIRNWQLHHLTLPDIEGLEEKFIATFPTAKKMGKGVGLFNKLEIISI